MRVRINVKDGRFVQEAYIDCASYNDIVTDNGLKATRWEWTAEILSSDKGSIIRVENLEDKTKSRTFKLQDGALFLDSYAYLRKASYMEFRDRFGIMGIVREDPNGVFSAECQEFCPVTSNIEVASDGTTEFGKDGYDRDTYWVSGATWAICRKHYGIPQLGGHLEECFESYLYTLEDDLEKLTSEMEAAGVSAPWWATGTALIR